MPVIIEQEYNENELPQAGPPKRKTGDIVGPVILVLIIAALVGGVVMTARRIGSGRGEEPAPRTTVTAPARTPEETPSTRPAQPLTVTGAARRPTPAEPGQEWVPEDDEPPVTAPATGRNERTRRTPPAAEPVPEPPPPGARPTPLRPTPPADPYRPPDRPTDPARPPADAPVPPAGNGEAAPEPEAEADPEAGERTRRPHEEEEWRRPWWNPWAQPPAEVYTPPEESSPGTTTGSTGRTGLPRRPDPEEGDDGPQAPEGMVLVPAGEYNAAWDEDEETYTRRHLAAFYIDRYPVTNRKYKEFIDETNHPPPVDPRGSEYNIWVGRDYPDGLGDHPVVNVPYNHALEYARWAGKRLPTEDQWQKAARGSTGFRAYPWGDEANPARGNFRDNPDTAGTTEVGSPATDRSPYGVHDMAGNVREWVNDYFSPDDDFWRTTKGGSFEDTIANSRIQDRRRGTVAPFVGFRCVADVPSN